MEATQTLDSKINEWAAQWDTNHDYKQDAIPEIYHYYKRYIAEKGYPYLDSVCRFISEHETVDNQSALKTQTYLASDQYRREQEFYHRTKMLDKGWKILDGYAIDQFNGKFVMISATGQGEIFNYSLDGKYKVYKSSNGMAYLMKPCARSKGYPICNLTGDVFYKIMEA